METILLVVILTLKTKEETILMRAFFDPETERVDSFGV
jgi:hypothetical protein